MHTCPQLHLPRLTKLAEERTACAVVLTSSSNVFYFTGFKGGVLLYDSKERLYKLVVPALEYLRARDTLEEEAVTEVEVIAYKPYGLPGGLELSRDKALILEGSLAEILDKLLPRDCKVLYDDLSLSFYEKLLGKRKLENASKDIAVMRAVKDPCEIERIERAAEIAEAALNKALSSLEPGVTEAEIAGIIEDEMRSQGADDHAFPPIVAFGVNTVYPHATPSARRRLEDGQPIIIDLGAVYKGYCSDMTRTIDYGGVGDEFTAALRAVNEAVEAALDTIRPGIRIGDVDKAAREVLEKNGLAKYFIHSLGHGVGIDVHEYPRVSLDNNDELREGMVITVEPGVYVPGKFGVRIEELVLVTKRGPRLLTRFPRELWL